MSAPADRIAEAFASHGRRAALMPYLMGGFPDHDTSLDVGRACIDAGADLIELGIPFSDPLADGPVIHAAGTAALRAGATVDGVLTVASRLAPRVPVIVMSGYTQILAGLDIPELSSPELTGDWEFKLRSMSRGQMKRADWPRFRSTAYQAS